MKYKMSLVYQSWRVVHVPYSCGTGKKAWLFFFLNFMFLAHNIAIMGFSWKHERVLFQMLSEVGQQHRESTSLHKHGPRSQNMQVVRTTDGSMARLGTTRKASLGVAPAEVWSRLHVKISADECWGSTSSPTPEKSAVALSYSAVVTQEEEYGFLAYSSGGASEEENRGTTPGHGGDTKLNSGVPLT